MTNTTPSLPQAVLTERLSFMAQHAENAVARETLNAAVAALSRMGGESVPAEPCRPDILEKLSYHAMERDDLTLDQCLTYMRTGGWHEVVGRTEREMVIQILALLAAAPTAPAQQTADVQGEALTDERCYDLVKEAGLDWQRGFSADVASGNRYTALCNLARRASAPTADPVRGDAPTIASQIDRMALAHGSLRRLAEVLGLDPGYLSRLRSGEKTEPSEEVLKALGLRKIVAYDLIYKATPLQPRTKSA